MSVETLNQDDHQPAPLPEVVQIKQAGEGAQRVDNPLEKRFALPGMDAYNKKRDELAGKSTEAGSDLLAFAKKFIGTPYKWGGSGPLGFDCSGFVQYVYRQFGVELPRVSYQQATAGQRVSLDDLRPGDLVAWDNSSRNNGADHIAIYIGNGQVIHAPKPGDSVKISALWDRGRAWGVRIGGLR